MIFTRAEFEHACKAYLSKYCQTQVADHATHDDALLKRYPAGWTWHEHPLVPGLGYLSRLVSIPSRLPHDDVELPAEDAVEELEDAATASVTSELLTCRQYVVYSPTFQVPAFYFIMQHRNGSPLSLDEIATSPLFVRSALPNTSRTTFALEASDSPFAMLSQGDHPTLNTPSWYLHPCHTAEVVGEIMKEVDGNVDRPLRWLEAWLMMLANVVDLRAE